MHNASLVVIDNCSFVRMSYTVRRRDNEHFIVVQSTAMVEDEVYHRTGRKRFRSFAASASTIQAGLHGPNRYTAIVRFADSLTAGCMSSGGNNLESCRGARSRDGSRE